MARGYTVTVDVVDRSGLPVVGATIVLAAGVMGIQFGEAEFGVGNPLSSEPVWWATTDPTGTAVISGLPEAGNLSIAAYHEHMVPTIETGPHARLNIDRDTRVSLAMEDLHAVVMEAPSADRIERVSWIFEQTQIEHGRNVLTRIPYARRALAKRFPSAIFFVQNPRLGGRVVEQVVGCRIVDAGGSVWIGSWPLTPIREIASPVYMSQDLDVKLKPVRVVLQDEHGGVIKEGLRLHHRSSREVLSIGSGAVELLEFGEYVATTNSPQAWLMDIVEAQRIVVSDNLPVGGEFRIVVPGAVGMVELGVDFNGEEVRRLLSVSIDDSEGQSGMIANWEPTKGAIQQVVRSGAVRIRVYSGGYYDEVDLSVDVGAGQTLKVPILMARSSGGR